MGNRREGVRAAGWLLVLASLAPGPVGCRPSPATGKASRPAGQPLTLKGHTGAVDAVCFSPGGQTLASGGRDGQLILWDVATGTPRGGGRNGPLWGPLAFTADGSTLAAGDDRGGVWLCDGATGAVKTRLEAHRGMTKLVAFVEDSKVLVTGDANGVIKFWDVQTRKEDARRQMDVEDGGSLAITPDGKTLASSRAYHDVKTVKVWDVATGMLAATLKGHDAAVIALALTPDGKTLASASFDKTARLWDVAAGKERAVLRGHTSEVVALAMTADGTALATGSWDGTVKLWDVATGGERRTLQAEASVRYSAVGTAKDAEVRSRTQASQVQSVAISADGRVVAAGRDDGTVSLWDVSTGD